MSDLIQSGFRLGSTVVDPKTGIVERLDQSVHVTPKAMEILLALAENAGELVDRETLIAAGWGGGSNHEEALTRVIAELRHALDDHHDHPEFIQTIPRRGYRLVAPVTGRGQRPQPQQDAQTGTGLWDELKRREVVRTSLAYAALAWLVIEVFSVVSGIFELPPALMKALVITAVAGLPIVIALSWALQRTPAGVALDLPVAGKADKADPGNARRIDMIIIAALLVAVSILAYREVGRPPAAPPAAAENSVAVLAFDNLSDNESDHYLGHGLAEEILNLLSQTEDLDVSARKASFYYEDKDVPLDEIVAALGVGNIVEGSVQRWGDRVRITVQLIDGASLTHRWSETYDSSEADLIGIRDSVARQVAAELKTVMTARGEEIMRRDAQTDRRAYMLYLRARDELRKEHSEETLGRAESYFTEAAEVDETFARARAGLCDTYLALFEQSGQQQAYFDEAEQACLSALKLDGELTEVYTALGNLYRVSGRLEQALTEFSGALELMPGNYDAIYGSALTLEAQGDQAGAEARFRELTQIEPGYWHGYNALGSFFYRNSRYPEAAFNFRRVTALAKDNALAFNNLGAAEYMQGEYRAAAQAWQASVQIRPSNLVLSNIGLAAYYAGDFGEAADMQRRAIEEAPEDFRIWGRLGDASRHHGDTAVAADAYGNAIRFASRAVELNPTDEEALRYLSLYLAHTGDHEAAIRTIERARELQPESSRVHYFASKVYLGAGDADRAARELNSALSKGYSKELADADPDLAPLRERKQDPTGERQT